MKFRQILCVLLTMLLLCSFVGCSSAPVRFKGAYTYSDPANRYQEPTLLFNDDGGFSFTDSADNLRLRGTYVYDKETKQLTLTAGERYTMILTVMSKSELQLVSFTDAKGERSLSVPDNAIFNIGTGVTASQPAAAAQAAS